MKNLIFDVKDEISELWSTERTIDELFDNLARTTCEIKVLGNNGIEKTLHYKKYYRQALKKFYRIPVWKPSPPFIIYLSDLSQEVRKSLEEYCDKSHKHMFRYIVTEGVGRILENIDFSYYHRSVMKKLTVRIEK